MTVESNNPPLPEPPPDMSDFTMTEIREGAPPRPRPILPDPGRDERGRPADPRRAQRRAPRLTPLFSREDWGTIIILAGIVVILGFVSGFVGGILGAAW